MRGIPGSRAEGKSDESTGNSVAAGRGLPQLEKELIRQIGRYRLWLQDNNLFSDDVSTRIRHGLELLIEDELTIAFVGNIPAVRPS